MPQGWTTGFILMLVEANGEPISFSGKAQRKPVDLLRALVSLGTRDVDERSLADALWPDAEGDAAMQSLATTLHRARKLLAVDDALVRSQGRVSLNPARAWVDAVASLEHGIDRAPLLETLHHDLIRANLDAGRVAAATAAYRRCQATLAQGLGVEPAPDTRALVAGHLANEAGPPGTAN